MVRRHLRTVKTSRMLTKPTDSTSILRDSHTRVSVVFKSLILDIILDIGGIMMRPFQHAVSTLRG